MKITITILTILTLISCGHNYENTSKQKDLFKARQSQKLDTLICEFVSNTGSLDLYYFQGELTLPTDIKTKLSDTLTRDIKVCGNFPKDLIDMNSFNYDSKLAFKIIGKIILADTIRAYLTDRVPLFYVTEYEKFNYDYNDWTQKGDLNSYPNRKSMVDGILENLKLIGQRKNEIENLLGNPDFVEQNSFTYKIDEDYGSDIDPISSTTLAFKFDKDSIVIEAKKNVWKKNSR